MLTTAGDFDVLINASPGEQYHLQQVTNFIDNMGLLTDFGPFDPIFLDPSIEVDPPSAVSESEDEDTSNEPRSRHEDPFRSWLPSPPPTDGTGMSKYAQDIHSGSYFYSVDDFQPRSSNNIHYPFQ